MNDKFLYLLIDFGCLLFPFIFSFHPKIKFHLQWKYFITSCILTALFFIVWDSIFTQNGVWGFNTRYTLPLRIAHLPIEEIMFFICIPYACVFTDHVLNKVMDNNPNKPITTVIAILLIGTSFTLAFLNWWKLYTVFTFAFLGFYLSFCLLMKVKFLNRFFIMYSIILIPFTISNGLLTGSWIEEPVVWYNNKHNLGLRLLTIPIEDVFYGMLLVLMNLSIYNYLIARAHASKNS